MKITKNNLPYKPKRTNSNVLGKQSWPGCSPSSSSLQPQNLCDCCAYECYGKRILESGDEYVQLWSDCYLITCRWERGRCRVNVCAYCMCVWTCLLMRITFVWPVRGRIWGFFYWTLMENCDPSLAWSFSSAWTRWGHHSPHTHTPQVSAFYAYTLDSSP